MVDQLKNTAKINAKGLDSTGVTEDDARRMAGSLGRHTMLVCEAQHATITTDADGQTRVTLVLTSVEPVPTALEDRVREFQRALYRQRPDVQGQETLQGVDPGPSLDQAAQQLDPAVWDGDTDGPLEPSDQGDDGTDGDERPWPGDAPAADADLAGEPAASDTADGGPSGTVAEFSSAKSRKHG